MLRVTSHSRGLTSRRSFLQAGVCGCGGLSLAELFRLQAAGAAPASDTSVILFWLSGGPGHLETWDPKPQAPREFRGPFGAISTRVPGVELGELMPRQAALMEHLAVLRTVRHGSGDHTKGNHWMLTGYEGPDFNAPDNRIQRRPAMGAVAARVRGPNRPGMPPYVAVPHLRGGTDNLFHYASYLGGGGNPFVVNSDPNSPKYQVRNLTIAGGLSIDRLAQRRDLLRAFDDTRRWRDATARQMDEHLGAALDLLTSAEVRRAFDIGDEPAALRDRYGRHIFGQSALLARRLVENGVPFVTVNCEPWDHHGSANRLQTEEGARLLIPPLDQALAGLVGDLIDRGMYQRTLIVAMGEFGRTPRINQYAGRDHWGAAFSVLLGGGKFRMGQVIGRTTSKGESVAERPLTPQDVLATVYHHLGIDGDRSFPDRLGRPMRLVESGRVIRELL